MAAARGHVEARNPEQTEFMFSPPRKVYWLDGFETSTSYASNTNEMQRAKRLKFLRARAAVAEEEARLELMRYPLFQPEGKFWLHTLSKLVYGGLLMMLHADDTGRDGEHALIVTLGVWAAELSVTEAAHLLTSPRLWLADTLNILELGGSTLGFVGISLRLLDIISHDPRSAAFYNAMYSFVENNFEDMLPMRFMNALFLALSTKSGNRLAQALIGLSIASHWTTQWCRLLSRSDTFGPLIVMAQQMVYDVAKFSIVLVGVIFGFAGALIVAVRGATKTLTDECGYLNEQLEGGGLLATVEALIELLLGHNIDVYECLKVSSQPMWAPLIMNGFRAIGVVLTLNMLIAQMVATYEKTRERLGISFKFQSSILMLSWFQKHSAVPAALRILSLPYFLLLALYQLPAIAMRLFSRCLRRMANDWSASRWLYDQFHPESPTPESPPIAATAATLREAATKHLKKCLGERTAEDDRWRARIAKELVELKEQGKMTNVTLKEQGEAMATKKELVDIKKEIVDEIVSKLVKSLHGGL